MAEYASKGVAGSGLGLGIAGTALGVLNGGLGNILGGMVFVGLPLYLIHARKPKSDEVK